jgi:hypothetical protein
MYSDSQTCTTNNTFYEVEPLIPVQNKTIKGEFSELEVEIREVNNVDKADKFYCPAPLYIFIRHINYSIFFFKY